MTIGILIVITLGVAFLDASQWAFVYLFTRGTKWEQVGNRHHIPSILGFVTFVLTTWIPQIF